MRRSPAKVRASSFTRHDGVHTWINTARVMMMCHAGLHGGGTHRPVPCPRLPADPLKQNYIAVCALADKLFGRIREVVASQLVPTTLKVRPGSEDRDASPVAGARMLLTVVDSGLQRRGLTLRLSLAVWLVPVSKAALDSAGLLYSQVALIEPLAAQLGVELSTSLFACTDDKFMGLFTGVRPTKCSFAAAV